MSRHGLPTLVLSAASVAMLAMPVGAQDRPRPDARETSRGAAVSSEYVIGVEDQLTISVWKEPELNLAVGVRPDGKITFPLVGDLQASGKTPKQLSQTLTEALSRYIKEPIVTVIVAQINNFKVYILGEVATQGVQVLRQRTRLLQVIAMAGGLTPYSNKKIVIVRDENGREARSEIDYRRIINGDQPETNVYLKPGDTIIVN